MLEADKAYHATLQFGKETDSGDLTGHVTAQAPEETRAVDEEALRAALLRFRGTIAQMPPMYSALKRNGKPLYEYARAGIELERVPRQVVIHHLELLACHGNEAQISVTCSKGTYIRTLAQDIGRALGCYAHLQALRRTRVGPFLLEGAVTLDTLQVMSDPQQALLAFNEVAAGLLPVSRT